MTKKRRDDSGAPAESGSRLGTWARVGLGLLVGIGMPFWPYSHGCGFKLLFYVVGVLAVVVAGLYLGMRSPELLTYKTRGG